VTGRVALVTGAARGQGRSHALALARAGADVAVCDLARQLATIPYELAGPADLEETARQVRETGRRCLAIQADAGSVAEMEAAVRRAVEELGGLDVVCANAGVINYGLLWELTEAQFDEVIATNLKGVWATCRAAVPPMLERGAGGSIVITGSAASLRGYPGISHYAAAKHGVVGLMRSLAMELARHGIRVNCVLPGGVRTPMGGAAVEHWLTDFPDASRALTALLPIDVVEPEDVTAAVLWLASDAARHVTGITLPVDGGVQLR
jgi:SDR family mycofactocin-dependent oxidoreductase